MSDGTSLFIRLYLDEDVHKRIATALRLRHFDVISAHETDRLGASDDKQLQFAAGQGRTLLTFNTPHYLQLHHVWLQENRTHAGIIVSDQLPIGETIRRLLNLLNHVTADEIYNQLYWLQRFK
ncbi:MAG TPA: DUF5615 family PIN-like protein [Candidatus Saccharimonadales bacterium]|nr:DUF5615 family PIN-like protein [Candidatus Saccharimonadales bacterium]